MGEKIAGITDEAVREATGEDWAAWLAYLDERNGTALSHQERVASLADGGVDSGWWQQTLAVGYERERGLREVGETADAGFEIGVQRTVGVDAAEVWEELLARPDRWLGDVAPIDFEPGTHYEASDGTRGEIRTRKDGVRLRLTWGPPAWDRPSTLQVTLEEKGPAKTTIRFHQEHLDSAETREAMRAHWRDVLDGLEAALTG